MPRRLDHGYGHKVIVGAFVLGIVRLDASAEILWPSGRLNDCIVFGKRDVIGYGNYVAKKKECGGCRMDGEHRSGRMERNALTFLNCN